MRDDSPSDTATLIARSMMLASQDPLLRRLVAKNESELLVRILAAGGTCKWFDWMMSHHRLRQLTFWIESRLLPGVIAHYLVRKRRIEAAVREALGAGPSQVVVLGAGFDTLAWRLHREFPQVAFLELDHPATQNVKQRALGTASNLHFYPVNLAADSLARTLRACPDFLPDRPAVFVAEGLTMYLTGARVGELMIDFAHLAGQVIFTFMERDAAGSIGFRGENPLIARWLRWRSEPFLWGISRPDLVTFLEKAGLAQAIVIDDGDLRREILEPFDLGEIPLARGECICLCSPVAR